MDPASLTNLRDIVEPTAITWWPLAPGLVLIAALVLLWTTVALFLYWRRWQHRAYRRAALQALSVIGEQIYSPQTRTTAIRQLSVLLKRVALAAYPRIEVASLTGNKWSAFLDQHINGDLFSQGPGRILTTAMIDPNPGVDLSISDCDHIIKAVRSWITGHRAEKNLAEPTEAGA